MKRVALAIALLFALPASAGKNQQPQQGAHLNTAGSAVAFRVLSTISADSECTGSWSRITVTRSTSAYCTKSDGTMVLLSANQPRVEANGLLVESAGTNLAIRSQEFENATWLFDQGGVAPITVTTNAGTAPDGTATAERFQIAAVGSGFWATKYQVVTLTAAAHTMSFYIKGTSGSGTIYPYMEKAGVFGTAATCSYTASSWTRCSLTYTTPSSGSWTTRIGIDTRITGTPSTAPANDFYVWGFQVELGSDKSSYYPTVASSATRSLEVAYSDISAVAARSYSVLATWNRSVAPAGAGAARAMPIALYKDASNRTLTGFAGTTAEPYNLCHWHSGGVDYSGTSSMMFPYTYNTGHVPFACSYDGTNVNNSIHGQTSNTARSFTVPAFTRVYLGTWDSTGAEWNGHIRSVCVGKTATACSSGRTGSTRDIAWVGDSLTAGDASTPTRPGPELNRLLQKAVYAVATGGHTAAQCLSNYRTNVKGKGYQALVVLCGVNSISGGMTDAQAWTDLQTLYDEARAEGLKLTPVLLTPWKNSSAWNGTRQGYTDALNTRISNYCTANSLTCVSTASMGGQGGDPLVLLTAYNSGDSQHFNAAGSTALATLVAAANP